MILSDKTIREEIKKGNIVIDPLFPDAIRSASIDLRLGYEFRLFTPSRRPYIDPVNHIDDYSESYKLESKKDYLTIHPGQFILGTTLERVELPNNMIARLDGRSSLGRLGVMIHATAGKVDPGWKGNMVLEISDIGILPVALYPEMRICQLTFYYLTTSVERAYGSKKLRSKYYGQHGVVLSKLETEFKRKGR